MDAKWTTLCAGLVSAALLMGCAGGPSRVAYSPPPDPPPIPTRKPPTPPSAAPERIQAVQTQRAGVRFLPSRSPSARQAQASAVPFTYVVRAGDTVYGIARKLGVPLREVIDANRLRPPYTLSVAQTLRIPNPRRHQVKRGETVYGISRGYGVEMSELVRLNRIKPPYTISPGARLVLPARPDAPPPKLAGAKPAPSPSTSPSTSPSPGAAPARKLDPPATTKPRAVQKAAAPAPAPRKPARLAAIPKPPPRAGSKFLWPTQGRLLATYGPKKGGLHNDGINIGAPRGTPVRAAENGVVVYSGNELRGFGNLILVKHAGGWVTAYAHTEQAMVRRGQQVKRGQVIAKVGSTGNVSKPQLHFEIRKGSRAVDPRRYLAPKSADAGVVTPL